MTPDHSTPGLDRRSIHEELRSFVHSRFPAARERALGDDAALLESGIVDSLGILDIIIYLEQRYGITVDDAELLPTHFASIAALAAFAEQKHS